MSRTQNILQRGFGIIELLVIVAIVALFVFLGWKAWETYSKQSTGQSNTSPTTADVSDIKSEQDLDKASSLLDKTDIDGSDSTAIDTQTDF